MSNENDVMTRRTRSQSRINQTEVEPRMPHERDVDSLSPGGLTGDDLAKFRRLEASGFHYHEIAIGSRRRRRPASRVNPTRKFGRPKLASTRASRSIDGGERGSSTHGESSEDSDESELLEEDEQTELPRNRMHSAGNNDDPMLEFDGQGPSSPPGLMDEDMPPDPPSDSDSTPTPNKDTDHDRRAQEPITSPIRGEPTAEPDTPTTTSGASLDAQPAQSNQASLRGRAIMLIRRFIR